MGWKSLLVEKVNLIFPNINFCLATHVVDMFLFTILSPKN
jgi:hypothetical protein